MSIEWNRTEDRESMGRMALSDPARAAELWRLWRRRLRFGTEIAILLVLCTGWLGYSLLMTNKVPERAALRTAQTPPAAAPAPEMLARDKLAEALLEAERNPGKRERHFPITAAWPNADASPAGTQSPPSEPSVRAPEATVAVAAKDDADAQQAGAAEAPTTLAAIEAPPAEAPAMAPAAGETTPQVPPSVSQAAPGAQAPRLEADERKALLDRATTMVRTGDIAGARVTLGRLVREQDPAGLLLMARTFDPQVLRRLGVLGIKGDASRAAHLYSQAAQAGSPEAELALKALSE